MHTFFPQTDGVSMYLPKLCQLRNQMGPNLASFGGNFGLAFRGKSKMQRVSAFCLLRWRKRVWMPWRKLRRWTQIFWITFLGNDKGSVCEFYSVHGQRQKSFDCRSFILEMQDSFGWEWKPCCDVITTSKLYSQDNGFLFLHRSSAKILRDSLHQLNWGNQVVKVYWRPTSD